jgi:hypothetical protein
MKNSNRCIKCQSTGIIQIPGRLTGFGGGNNILLPPRRGRIFNGGVVMVTRYLCDACGYSEEWIDRPEDIAALKQAFMK